MGKALPTRPRLQVQELEQRLLYSADAAAWLGAQATENPPGGGIQAAPAALPPPAATPATTPQEPTRAAAREFIFIDSRVPDAARLADELMQQRSTGRSFDIVLLLPDEDGVAKIAQLLAQERDLAALHIISHGSEGLVQLGAAWLNPAALEAQAEALRAWGQALAPQGDLLLYGCDVAAGAEGQGLLQQLAVFTGADVAASGNATGLGQAGADVELEAHTGAIETRGVIQPEMAWSGVLALTPQGGETRVNTNTIGNQSTTVFGGGAVAVDSLGNYVVVWADDSSNAGDVFFQRYNAAGVAQGPNVRANTNVASAQSDAVVAMDSAGNFVVVWQSSNQDGSGEGVYAQRYNASGVAQGVEFRVSTTFANNQWLPTVAMAPGGAFVVAWTDDLADSSGPEVFAQRYNAAGVAQGAQFQVNTTTAQSQSYASAAMDGSGNFVITWEGAQTGDVDVYGQRYNAAGVAQGGEFRANTETLGIRWNSAVAMDNTGNFVVVWESTTQDSDGSAGIYAQRFNASGVAQGGEFRVNTTVANGQTLPAVAMNATGGFVVTWQSSLQDGSSEGVYAREFSAAGVAQGSELRINTTTANNQSTPSVGYRGSQAVVAWSGEGPGDSSGVFMQRLATSPPPGITVGAISGNTSEAGASATFTVVLDGAPSANVTVPVSSSNLLEGTVSTSVLTFTSANWNVSRTVTVTGVNDTVVDGNRAFTVVLGPASSADAGYNGMNVPGVAATNVDNDTQSTLTVNTTADTVDGTTTSLYALLANPGADGRISLREAITAANASANGVGGVDRIHFNIPEALVAGAHTITLNSNLPALTDGVLIDGTTEPDWAGQPVVVLDGSNAGALASGLTLDAGSGGSRVSGLQIQHFARVALVVQGAGGQLIGGVGSGNVLVANGNGGIDISSAGNVVTGNAIGTNFAAAAGLGNGDVALRLLPGANNNRIGGTLVGEGNTIANTTTDAGIATFPGSTGNALLGNRIYGNFNRGIDLAGDGVTLNDVGDTDVGSNDLQNFPVLTSATSTAGNTTITGTFNSNAATTFRIEYFSSPNGDGTGYGEGQVYLGFSTLATDGSGNATINATLTGISVTPGHVVSATATVDLGGGNYASTSEFAANVVATAVNTAPAELLVTASNGGGLQINAAPMGDSALVLADTDALFGGRGQLTVEWRYSSPGRSNGSDALLNYLAPGRNLELLVLRNNVSDMTLAIAGQTQVVSGFDYSVLEDGQVHGLALTWNNATGAWTLSVDGVLRSSGAGLATGLTLAADGELHVGQQLSSIGGTYLDNRGWQATLHGLRVFDDVRSASEIGASWRSALPNTEPGLVADWRFDQLTPSGEVPNAVAANSLLVQHTGNPLHVADTPALTLTLPENSLTGTVVGQVQGVDADREARIAQMLSNDPSLSYSAITGKFYRGVAATGTWAAALANATSSLLNGVAGQMITIRSAADQAVAQAMTLTLGHHVWLGATDLGVEGQWRWYAGSSAGDSFWLGASSGAAVNAQFTRWAPNEPNGGAGDNRLTMYYINGLWNDADGLDASIHSIIEWDADAVLDALAPLTYSITAQTAPGAFTIDASGGQLVVANGLLLDHEVQATHSVTVQVSDGSSTVSRVLTVNLTNLAEASTAPTGVASGLSLNEDGGNDAYLRRNDGGSLLGGATALTLEAAFTTTDAGVFTLVSYHTPADAGPEDDGLRLQLRADGEWRLVINGAGVAGLNLGLDDGSSRDGSLHHAAVTWDSASGAWTFHLDGKQVSAGSGYATGQAVRPGGTLVVGQEQDSIDGGYTVGGGFTGALYDLRLWNHARTATEIALNAQQKFSPASLPAGLVANWQMNGLNGSNEVVDVVAGRNLAVAHASGTGFTASTPQPELAVKENTPNGTHVGYVMPVAPAVANDVVADGRFLQAPGGGTFSQGSTFGAWTVESGDVDLYGAPWQASPYGGRVVDLNGLVKGVISQTLATEAGRQYQVVFQLAGNFQGGTDGRHLRVSADGVTQDFAVARPPGWANSNLQFSPQSLLFTASGSSTTLRFAGMDANPYGAMIADVQVLEVPSAVSTILNADATLRFNAATNKFYRAVAAPADWNAAQSGAQAATVNGVAGQLVTIGSAYENQSVQQLGQELSAGWAFWLGATDAAVEGTWRWARGTGLGSTFWVGGWGGAVQPGQYANWLAFEPNNNGNEDAAFLEWSNGGWNDNSEAINLPYVIEWDATAVLGHYRFDLPASAAGRFALNAETGEVTVANASLIDYEAAATHNITVQANDAQAQGFAAVLPVAILNQGGEPTQVLPLATQNLNEDTAQVFSVANGNAITVGDTDAASNLRMELSLSVGQGSLTLSSLTGLFVVAGANGSAAITVRGPESALNAALDGLIYQPTLNYTGVDALTVTTALGANLSGHYVFEGGNANDVSAGGSQDGVFAGDAGTLTDTTRGSVLALDGVGDVVAIASDFGNPADLTLATWVNVDATQAQQADLIHIGFVGALQFNPAGNGTLTAALHDGSQWQYFIADANLRGTGWHHVAFSWNDTTSALALYLDGVALPTTLSTLMEAGTPFGQTLLGGDWASGHLLKGRMDDARIYMRALGSAEVAALAVDHTAVTGNVALQVNPVNDAPVANNDTLALTEDTRAAVAVLANDTDADGHALSVTGASIDLDGDGFNDALVLGGFSAWLVQDNSAQAIGTLDFNAGVFGFTPATNYLGAVPVLTYTANDGNGGSALGTLTFGAIAPVNDAPTVNAPASVNVQPQQAVTPAITVADVDAGNAAVRLTMVTRDFTALTLSGTSGATLGGSTSTPGQFAWTIDGTLAQIQTELAALTLRTAAGFFGTSTVTLTLNDLGNSGSGGALLATTNLALVVDAANDAPAFTGLGGAVAYTEGAAPVVLAPGTTVFDAELNAQGHYAGALLALARNGGANAQDVFSATGLLAPLVEGGSLVYGGTTIGTVATHSAGQLVLAFNASATQARVDGTLQAIAYAHASDAPPASVVVNWSFNDGNAGAQGSGGALNANGAVTVNITGTNDAPVITSGGGGNSVNLLAPENTTAVTNVTATDPDFPAQTLTYSLSGGADMALFAIDANTGVLSFLVPPNYEAPQDFNADNVYDVQVRVSDGSLSDAQDVVVTVTNANDAPQLSLPASYSATEQQSLSLHGTGISVADADAGTNPMRLVVSVASGELSAVAGGTGVLVSGSGTAAVTLTGSLAQLNDLLAGNAGATLTFLNPSDAPAASELLSVQADDQGFSGPGGALVASATASISIVAVNDAPTVLLPTAQSLDEDATLVLSSGNGNNIAINELDTGSAPLRVTLTVSSGTLTLASTTGLTFLSGDGTADASMSFEGINTALYAALNGLAFTPAANMSGAVTLTVTANDLGNSGTGGALSDTQVLAITVNPVNDAPVIGFGEGAQVYNEGGAAILVDALATVSDIDSPDFAGGHLLVNVPVNGWSGDAMAIRHQGMGVGQVGVVGADVFFGGVQVGSFTGSAAPLDVAFNASADLAAVQAVMRNITYRSNEDMSTMVRTVQFTLQDGDGGTSAAITKQITPLADHRLWVTTEADTADGDTSSITALLADRGADGFISLREAILATNNTANAGGPDEVYFNIAGSGLHHILPGSALPTIDQALVLDASTDDSFAANGNRPAILIDGNNLAGPGLVLGAGADGSTVRGLLIRDFTGPGLLIDTGSDNHLIAGNYLGALEATGADAGAPQANTGAGLVVRGAGSTIGGPAAQDANLMAYNGAQGVLVEGALATGNSLLGNRIHGNAGLGVDLGGDGVSPNDADDLDAGANDLFNQAVLGSVNVHGGETTVVGRYTGLANTTVRLELYRSATADASGHGEGEALLATLTLNTGPTGAVDFVQVLAATTVPLGEAVSALATADLGGGDFGSTSEFSNSVTVTHNAPGVVLGPISGATTEAGGTATFTVALNTAPTAAVTMALTSSHLGEGTVNLGSVSFTPQNWNVAQTVTVTGVNDFVDDGDTGYSIVTGAAVSADTRYHGLNAADVAAVNTDDDTAGIAVGAVSGNTTETGGTATFTVVLNTQPTADVTIALSSGDPTEGAVSASSLTFTALNWNVAQTVTVAGANDNVADGDISFAIVTAAATSGDANYQGLNAADVVLTNLDDDATGINVSAISGPTTEAGGTASFTVVLNSQPTSDVTLALSSDDLTEGTVSTSSLTFTALNWNLAQTVTVTGVDDLVADGNRAFNLITGAASSGDANYGGMNVSDVAAVNTDDDTADITVSVISGPTTEAGGTASFTVVLNSQPTADVVIAIGSSDLTEGTVGVTSLTFTALNWSIAQSVNVTGVNDNVDDGDTTFAIVTAAASSLDANYNGLNAANVVATNQDDDTAGTTVSAISGVTTEAGGTATFSVVLNSQPTADVTMAVGSDDLSEGAVSVGSLTFTALNWNVAQTVTVTGLNDLVDDGDVAFNIVTGLAVSADANYNGLNVADVAAVNLDDDVAGISVSALSGNTTEAGGPATFTVVLNSQPAANVTIALSSSNLAEGSLNTGSLTFTPANWNTAQTVTVTGVNDAVDDGDQTFQVITDVAASTDPGYGGMAVVDVSALNRDDDTAGLTLSTASGPTTEAGGSASFSVALSSQPLADVVIQLDTLNPGEGVLNRSQLTFTPANWNLAQSVGVAGVDDAVADGATAFAVRAHVAASADGLYSALPAANVAFVNQDDDVAGVWVGAVSGDTTESGGSASFQVRLTSQPTAEVVIAVNSSDAQQGTLAVASLRFDAGNWNLPQTVVVTGVSDGVVDGDTLFQVVLAPTVSLDANYNGTDAADVVVLNRDNTAPRWLGPVSFDLAEHNTAVANLQAQDDDLPANTLQFSLAGGADAAWFQIDPQTGALRFVNAPDHELPGDANRDNLYDLQVQVSDGWLVAVQPVQVRVQDINDQVPRIDSDGAQSTALLARDENGTWVTQVIASDADATSVVTFQIVGGADAARFQIDTQTGLLSFLAAPDFEQPADAASRNRFDVVVQASDGAFSDTQAITVVLGDLNDNAPVVADPLNPTASENTREVLTLTASDADAGSVFTYRIAGGADAALFEVDANTGALRFTLPRDFEAPNDADRDGLYEVWVAASDGANEGLRALQVGVLDANEAPTAATLSNALDEGAALRVDLLAAATDPDAGQPGLLDPGAVRIEQTPVHGRLQLQPDGSVVYTHDGSETTEDSFRYSVADALGLRSPVAQVSLRIAPVNDAPQLQAMSVSLRSGQTVALDPALFQIQDPDSPRSQWVFDVVQLANARLERVAQPGLAISQFSQLDVDAGRVRLVSTNALEAPVITLRAGDGALPSEPRAVTVQFVVQIEPEAPVTQTPNRPAPPAPAPEPTPDPLPQDLPAPAPAPVTDRERLTRSDKAVAPLGLEDVDELSGPQGAAGLGRASAAAAASGAADSARVLAAADDTSATQQPSRSLRENVTVGFDLLQPLSLDAFLSSLSVPMPVQDVEAFGAASLGRLAPRGLQDFTQAPNTEENTGEFKFSTQEAVQLTGVALTAGTVWWALRAGGLLASLAMGLPAWRHVDLLAVLPDDEDDDNWSGDQDDEAARDERAVDRVFAAGMPKESEA